MLNRENGTVQYVALGVIFSLLGIAYTAFRLFSSTVPQDFNTNLSSMKAGIDSLVLSNEKEPEQDQIIKQPMA